MKKIFLILLSVCVFQMETFATDVNTIGAKIEKAEQIWMKQGLHILLNNVRYELQISNTDFENFQIIYNQEALEYCFYPCGHRSAT